MSDRVALAFESGGDPALCGEALSVLGAAGKRATIFLDGMWAERNPVKPGQWRARLLPTPPLRHRAIILVMG